MKNEIDKDWTLDRIISIIDRWDKPEYTTDSLSMRGLISELRQAITETKDTTD